MLLERLKTIFTAREVTTASPLARSLPFKLFSGSDNTELSPTSLRLAPCCLGLAESVLSRVTGVGCRMLTLGGLAAQTNTLERSGADLMDIERDFANSREREGLRRTPPHECGRDGAAWDLIALWGAFVPSWQLMGSGRALHNNNQAEGGCMPEHCAVIM